MLPLEYGTYNGHCAHGQRLWYEKTITRLIKKDHVFDIGIHTSIKRMRGSRQKFIVQESLNSKIKPFRNSVIT